MNKKYTVDSRQDGVISVTFHQHKGRRMRHDDGRCAHTSIVVDDSLLEIECMDCNEKINPVTWIIQHMEFIKELKHVIKQKNEAVKHYENRKRCRCHRCGKMTPIDKKQRYQSGAIVYT